ncbi:MAG TPA: hypothetical protein P5558_00490 [Geminicoccaceae bacterium]|nr:hypothetical protein [Geminicoccaceae bacterium]
MTNKGDDRLADRLQLVDDQKLRDVVRMLESTRERGAVEPILAALRPRLRRLRPERPLTLQRLLTVPLEGALATAGDGAWSFVVDRSRLGELHEAGLAGLPPGLAAALETALAGRLAHETDAILEHGRTCWPAAAAALAAAAAVAGLPDRLAVEQRRVADLLAIAPDLVPLLGRLPRPLQLLDDDDKGVLGEILALALAGSDDRCGTLLTLLLRSTRRPAALVDDLLAAVEPAGQDRLRPLIDRILAEHRATLDSLLDGVVARPEAPVAQVAEAVERVAEAVVDEAGAATALGRRAGAMAESRYLAAIQDLAMSPVVAGDAPTVLAGVRERETAARAVAKLGRAAGRLTRGETIERATREAVEALVESAGHLTERVVHVRVARLIEILAGADRAWAHLRRHRA